jgi:carboxypeptidase C (cathepsin A)
MHAAHGPWLTCKAAAAAVPQPINTGFSYSNDERDRVFDEKVVAADMLDFLAEFREAHPAYFKNDLYVTGESYGGHYVPAVTYGIFKYNQVRRGWHIMQNRSAGRTLLTGGHMRCSQDAKKPFCLKGMAIGNGLTGELSCNCL